MTTVYKICRRPEWEQAVIEGVYRGSVDDLRDGFIHFSTIDQVPATRMRHFRDVADLVLVTVDGGALGAALRWEPARGGELFPHLYGPLPLSAVTAVEVLPPTTAMASMASKER